jgi:hypothetical protein
VLDGQLVGCGRVLPFDQRRGWLESLRVDPDLQGRGLGREMSRHVIRVALEMGLQELMFSTYFDNRSSIAISEGFGFRRIATFTHLHRQEPDLPVGPPPGDLARVRVIPGIPRVDGFLRNDWFFVPSDAPGLEAYFPKARTVTDGACTLMLCENEKYPTLLEIGWLEAPGGIVSGVCIDFVLETARREGREGVHLMLPAGMALPPFAERGFHFHEQEQDVYLYAARAGEIRV